MTKFEDLSDNEKWAMTRDAFSKLESRVNSLATLVGEIQKEMDEFKKKFENF